MKLPGFVTRFIQSVNCRRGNHEVELIVDEYGFGADMAETIGSSFPVLHSSCPYRHCIFKCAHCTETFEFERVAYLEGSGALYYFFDRKWPTTKDTKRINRTEHESI
jgi:hypothetical protein